MTHARELRLRIIQLENELVASKKELTWLVNRCIHSWTTPVSDDIHVPYHIEFKNLVPREVSSKIINRWKRECTICGELQYTVKTRQEVNEYPDFD